MRFAMAMRMIRPIRGRSTPAKQRLIPRPLPTKKYWPRCSAEPNRNLRPRMHSVGSEFMFLSMFLFIFDSPVQIAMVIGVIVLLFGAGRLPQLAKSLGQSRKAFKEGMREAEEDEKAEPQKISSGAAAPQVAR